MPDSWRLRIYLLRHLLEFHFGRLEPAAESVELVIDRVTMSSFQKRNMDKYLSRSPVFPLDRPFNIPPIEHITMADSRYVEGLQLAHLLAELTADVARGSMHKDLLEATHFFGAACLLGQVAVAKTWGAGHPNR